jgi:uncharacterized phage protein gp47/JayE
VAFRTKSFVQIIGSMLGQFRASQSRLTDYSVGGVARTMLEAPAAELDQLYQEMAQGLTEAIPTAIYRSFDFNLLGPATASGVLRFTPLSARTAPIVIAPGFVASTATGLRFETAEEVVIPVGAAFVDVLASAQVPGLSGNVATGAIFRQTSTPQSQVTVTNPQGFMNGRAQEAPAERKLRFVETVRSLACGTPASCVVIAKTATIVNPRTGLVTERVVRAEVSESTGHMDLFVHNGGGRTSAALVARAQQLVDGYDDETTGLPVSGYRPGGMRVDVSAMTEIPVPVQLSVDVPLSQRSDKVLAALRNALGAVVQVTPSGGRLLPIDLVNAALALGPVTGATIDFPTAVVPCPSSAVLVPGDLTVLWAT